MKCSISMLLLFCSFCNAGTFSLTTSSSSSLRGGGELRVDVTHVYDDETYLLVDSSYTWDADPIDFIVTKRFEQPAIFPDPPEFEDRMIHVTGRILNIPDSSSFPYHPVALNYNDNILRDRWEFGGFVGVRWDPLCPGARGPNALCTSPIPVFVELTMEGPFTTRTEILELDDGGNNGVIGGGFTNVLIDGEWQPLGEFVGRTLMGTSTLHDEVTVGFRMFVLSPIVVPEPSGLLLALIALSQIFCRKKSARSALG